MNEAGQKVFPWNLTLTGLSVQDFAPVKFRRAKLLGTTGVPCHVNHQTIGTNVGPLGPPDEVVAVTNSTSALRGHEQRDNGGSISERSQ